MSGNKSKPKQKESRKMRSYAAESPALTSLRMIAAPNPKDDLSDDELAAICKDPRQSPELIRYLIEFVKKL